MTYARASEPALADGPRHARRTRDQDAHAILALQRAHGNQAVARAIAGQRTLAREDFYPDKPDEREKERKGVEEQGHVKKALERRDETAGNVRKVRVGVTFRTDGNGKAHTDHDLEAVRSISKLPGLPKVPGEKTQEIDAPEDVALQVEGITLPRGASGGTTPARVATVADLKDIDLLYVPGAPTANDTQTGMDGESRDLNRVKFPTEPTKPIQPVLKNLKKEERPAAQEKYQSDNDQYKKDLQSFKSEMAKQQRLLTEHTSRSQYELKLISLARSMGIPTIAICAGSWRLLEAFGGQVETLPQGERDLHKAPQQQDVWNIGHGVETTKGSMLSNMMGGQDGAKPMTNVNSTHWAVASINETGELTQAPKQSQVPKDELVVNAYSSGIEEHSQKALTEKTVEGFETVRGVPMLGVQWHPEGYLPGMTGENSGSAQSREQSRKIFEAMSKVALTSGQRRHALNQELGGEEAAFKRFCEAFGQYAKGNAEQGSLLYEQVAALLPKHLWSARLDELDRALKLLQKALVAEESEKNRLNEEVRVILADNGVK